MVTLDPLQVRQVRAMRQAALPEQLSWNTAGDALVAAQPYLDRHVMMKAITAALAVIYGDVRRPPERRRALLVKTACLLRAAVAARMEYRIDIDQEMETSERPG